MQVVLGEQQVEIRLFAAMHGQAPHHVPLGSELGDGEAIDHHLHHRLLGWLEMARVRFRKLHGGEQTVVEWDRHKPLLLPFHLGQQAGGAAFEDALHTTLRRTSPPPLPGDAHQHAVAVPGVIELMIPDVDVLAAVIAQGEAEALARAAQPGRDQFVVRLTEQACLVLLNQVEAEHGVEPDAQLLFLLGTAQAQRLLEPAELNHLVAGELIEKIGDRELHRSRVGNRDSGEALVTAGRPGCRDAAGRWDGLKWPGGRDPGCGPNR